MALAAWWELVCCAPPSDQQKKEDEGDSCCSESLFAVLPAPVSLHVVCHCALLPARGCENDKEERRGERTRAEMICMASNTPTVSRPCQPRGEVS